MPLEEQEFLRAAKIDKPEPYDFARPRAHCDDDEDEFSDPADLAVDHSDPRDLIVDFESVDSHELKDYCDHFGSALVWATRGKPDLYQMGKRMITILMVMRPEAVGKMKMKIHKSQVDDLQNTLVGRNPLETGEFFYRPIDWIRDCTSLVQLGKRAFAAIYVLRGDLIDAATCAAIGGMDNRSRQAANKPMQEFSDTFKGIKSLPMRGNKTRRLCKRAQQQKNK